MRILLALIFALSFASAASAQLPTSIGTPISSQLESLGLVAYTNEWVSITGVAAGLNATKVADANVAFITVQAKGGNIIWTRTGQNPTTSYGNVLYSGGTILLSPAEGALLKMIRENSRQTVNAIVEYYAAQGTTPIP